MSDYNEASGVIISARQEIPYTRVEIEDYIFAGMKAMNALEKWGGEDDARRHARFLSICLFVPNAFPPARDNHV